MTASRPDIELDLDLDRDAAPGDLPIVRVNDDLVPWHDALDLAALVATRGLDPRAIATAVNGTFVPRARRAGTTLRPGDQVVLVAAIVGG